MSYVHYRETCTDNYDCVTTRWWEDHDLTTEEAGELLTKLSKQNAMLWEALDTLRSLSGDLDLETRRAFVNHVCSVVFHPGHVDRFDKCEIETLERRGIRPALIFYDVANIHANDPYPEAWGHWNPALPNNGYDTD